jgi:uncharacterized protein (UPF0305 family)
MEEDERIVQTHPGETAKTADPTRNVRAIMSESSSPEERNGDGETARCIQVACGRLGTAKTRGELGREISALVREYSPRDLQQLRWNFSEKISDLDPGYRKILEEKITAHLHGTYRDIHMMKVFGVFSTIKDPLPPENAAYWKMVAGQCAACSEGNTLRFLKFLISGFCMLVQVIPGHPAGMPFPGGDRVEQVDGVWFCPVREKANDVDSALCPFCPAVQTPEVGYLRPPVSGSRHRKQEFIQNCYEHHNFNG